MKVTSPHTLARLLYERLAEGGDPKRAVTLAQLLDDHLAYSRVRPGLQLAGKGEYDVAVLGLLADRSLLQADPALEAAARRELEGPEPGLTFAGALAERLLRLRDPGLEPSGGKTTLASGAPLRRVRPTVEPKPTGETAEEPEATTDVEPERVAEPEPAAVAGTVPEADPAEAEAVAEPEREPEQEPEQEPEPVAGGGRAVGAESTVVSGPTVVSEPGLEIDVAGDDPDPGEMPGQAAGAARAAAACWACSGGLPDREGIRFCPRCGVDQEAPRCTACGDRLESDWAFCPRCGRALDA